MTTRTLGIADSPLHWYRDAVRDLVADSSYDAPDGRLPLRPYGYRWLLVEGGTR